MKGMIGLLDLFNLNDDRVVKTTKVLQKQILAVLQILLDKDIVSEDELKQYLEVSEKQVEKIYEREVNKQKEQFEKEYPGIAKIFGME